MADTQTIPKPPEPIAKPATARAAAMELIDDAAHLDGAAPRELSPGDADDLIAQMADAQIDQLLAEDDDGRSPAMVSASEIPTFEPEAIVPTAPPAAVAMTAVESTPIETFVPRELPAEPALAPLPPLSPLPTDAAFPASFSPPQSKRPQVTAAPDASPFAETAPIVEPPLAPAATSAAELAGLLATTVEPTAPAPMLAVPAPAIAEPAYQLQSSADAVAAELAADALRTPPRGKAEPPKPDAPAAPSAILAVPAAAIDLINYPVSGLSDTAREVVGAIAIVTLANATALLIYLVLFRA